MRSSLRLLFAVLFGNALGYAFFRLAAWAVPEGWRAAAKPIPFVTLLWMTGLTAIAFGTPPMMVSALAARIARRHEPMVGLAAALWGVTAWRWWPAQVPLLPPESWIAPMGLIMLSGLVGGWLAGRGPHED